MFAAALAVCAPARALTSLLVDADPWGGGIDLLLGCEDMPGLRWPDLSLRGGQVPSAPLMAALPGRADEVAVLAAGRDPAAQEAPVEITTEALLAVVDAGRRSVGVTVVDLPRRAGGVTAACAEVADLVVLVTTATVRGAAATRAAAAALGGRARELRLVVRGPAPGGLTARDVERAVGVPVAAAMRPQPGLDAALDGGGLNPAPSSPLAAAAGRILDGLAVRRAARGDAA
ncbi:septum site-determining protein Ssd [Tsukamurella soli]|uniref:septum site-determining protein Ssd n=1 Tax=Tsukamurella soli TaxID=644556 RepID=UPI00362243FD